MSPAWLRCLGSLGKTAAVVILELLAGTSCNMGTTWVVTSTPTVHSNCFCPCNRTLHKALPPMHTQLCAAAQLPTFSAACCRHTYWASAMHTSAPLLQHMQCRAPPHPLCQAVHAITVTYPPAALHSALDCALLSLQLPLANPWTHNHLDQLLQALHRPLSPAGSTPGRCLPHCLNTHALHHSSSSSSSSSSSASSSHLMKGSMSFRNTLRPLGWLPFLYLRAQRNGVECGDDRVTKVHSCYSNQDMSHGARATVKIHTEAWQGPFNHTRLHNP
jgi:hypothetical protein